MRLSWSWPWLLAAATAVRESDFQAFVRQHKRSYKPGSSEFEERQRIFEARAEEVQALNRRPSRHWTAGLGPLADYRDEELRALRGWRGHIPGAQEEAHSSSLVQVRTLPEQFNWTSLASLRDIANQGGCGSCWAVTSAAVLSAHAEIHSKPRSFSAQELVDCVPNPKQCGGKGGCSGATVELAMNYAMHLGLRTESEAPYTSKSHTCGLLHPESFGPRVLQMGKVAFNQENRDEAVDEADQSRAQVQDDLAALAYLHQHLDLQAPRLHRAAADSAGLAFGLHGWEKLTPNRQEPLLRAVYEHGPVGVSVAAMNWHLYAAGIFDHCVKDAVIDHAVTLIGYGRDVRSGEKFYLIQNSWGNNWGEGGRIRLFRTDADEANQCGWDRQPDKGTACTGDPSQVRVCGMCGILYDSVVPHFREIA